MSFTSPTDDIIIQEGTFAFDYTASGTVYGGQCVVPEHGPGNVGMYVKAAGTTTAGAVDNFIGVAAYQADNGEKVAVYGPGNIVRCIVSGASNCNIGDDLMTAYEGKVTQDGAAAGKKIGVALETQATANGTVKVLLT